MDQKPPVPVKPADALGTLGRREQASRVSVLVVVIVVFLALAFIIGYFLTGTSVGGNSPDGVPTVDVR